MPTILKNGTIYTGSEVLKDKAIYVDKDRIVDVIDNQSIPASVKCIDCNGDNISAGLIDLQIAGSGGFLFSIETTEKALNAIADSIVQSGTTGFLIVVPTNTFETYRRVIRILKANINPAVLGLHLEGPYISPLRRGAHLVDLIKKPDITEIKKLLDEAEGVIKMVTVAPEICNDDFIKVLTDNEIVVAAGHTNATYEEAFRGFRSGISTVTHLYNAMSPLHHRDPGVAGAVFESPVTSASIIVDGVHVHYAAVSIAKQIMKERLFLISDAVEGNLDGIYPNHIRQNDRFTLPDGTLSGSLLTMMTAVKNCVCNVGIPLEEALRMASFYPARLMGLSEKGSLATGKKADIVVFNEQFEIKHVFVEGEKVV